jgi:hypothetical protein
MKATKANSTGVCERCEQYRPFVIATGFNPDGSFRHLCASCDRIEQYTRQRPLFADLYQRPPRIIQPEPEEEEPEPDHSNQLSMFG